MSNKREVNSKKYKREKGKTKRKKYKINFTNVKKNVSHEDKIRYKYK